MADDPTTDVDENASISELTFGQLGDIFDQVAKAIRDEIIRETEEKLQSQRTAFNQVVENLQAQIDELKTANAAPTGTTEPAASEPATTPAPTSTPTPDPVRDVAVAVGNWLSKRTKDGLRKLDRDSGI